MGEPKLEKWKKQKTNHTKDGKTSSIYLPEEIVIDILTRIPVKALLQFRTVCKKWNSLIRHPSFIHVHHERAQTRPDGGTLIISACMHRQIYWGLCVYNVPYEGGLAHRVTNGPVLNAYKASKSVNGLIALFPKVFGQPVYLSNPSTRELICLPLSNLRSEDLSVQLYPRYSFGYDQAIQQYKVLNICCAFNFSHNNEHHEKVATYLEIFTVGSNTWRTLDNVEPPRFRLSATSVCVNGAIHWRAFPPIHLRNSSTRNVIVAFDIGVEKFRVIPLSGRPASLSQLMDVGGYLGLIGLRIGAMEEMWVLEDYENGVWTHRVIKVPSNLITSKVTPIPIGGIGSGNYLVISTDKKCLGVYYCDKEERFRQFKVSGLPESNLFASFAGAMEVSYHVESLLSPRIRILDQHRQRMGHG